MKVLFLTNLPSPYRVGFFSELGKQCDLTVLYERHSASDRHAKWALKGNGSYREIYLHGKQVGADNSFCPEVIAYLNGEYDKIVVAMYSTYTAMTAIAYMKWKRIPYIISTDGGFAAQEGKGKALLKRKLLSSAAAWLATGKAAKEYLEHYGARSEDIYIYPFASLSEQELLKRALSGEEKRRLRQKLGIKGERVGISVGQFIERKGFDILVEAIKRLRTEAEFYIVGGTREQLEQLIGTRLPDGIHAVPFLEKEKLFDFYCASDMFVLPTREDIWGLVIGEAMACGLPVITTERCGAGAELVQDGINGYLVPVENVGALADKMELLFLNDYVEMGKRSLELIEKYTFESMAQKHLQILEQIH